MMMPLLHYGKRGSRASDDLRRGRIHVYVLLLQVKSNGNYSMIAHIYKKIHITKHIKKMLSGQISS